MVENRKALHVCMALRSLCHDCGMHCCTVKDGDVFQRHVMTQIRRERE